MRYLMNRSAKLTILATVLFVSTHSTNAAAPTVGDQLDRAATLYDSGQLVEAQRLLYRIERSELTAEQRNRLMTLGASLDRKLRRADPIEVSLEKAQIALREGDLRQADRQAQAVRRSDAASKEQRSKAQSILDQSAQTKIELAPMIDATLAQAQSDFDAQRYSEAKAGFDSVYRSGVELTPAQLQTIDRYRDRIGQIEFDRGKPFAMNTAPMAVFQPDAGAPAQPEETESKKDAEQPDEDQESFQEALKFEAQRHLAQADKAFDEGRYPSALENYLLLTGQYREHTSAEDLKRAEARIVEIRALLQEQGGGILPGVVNRAQLVRDRAIAEFDNLLNEAKTSLAAGDTEHARELAGEARLRLSEARNVFSEQEYQQRLGLQQSVLQNIVSQEESIRQRESAQRTSTLEQQAKAQEAQRQADKQQKINESLQRIRTLQLEQKYPEALQVVDQVLFLDPLNPAALLMKDTLQDLMLYYDWTVMQRDSSLSIARELNKIEDATIMPESILSYPPDWPEISFRRGEPIAFQVSPEDRKVLAALRNKRGVPAKFSDARLEDVLDFFAQVTNMNLDVDWESLADIGISRDDLVTLNLQPLPAQTVLERVLRKVSPDAFSRANWAVEDGVLVIASDDALRRNTFVVLYDIRDLLFQIRDFTDIPNLGLGQITQGQGGGSNSGNFQPEDSTGPTEDDILQKIIDIIQANIDTDGWKDNGGDTGDVNDLNGNLIITNTMKNHQAIAGLLSQLREVRSIQIAVDTRFLLVNQNFFEQIGFDLDVIFNASNSQFQDALANQNQFPLVPADPNTFGTSTLLPSDLVAPFFTGARQGGSPEFAIQNFDDLNMPGNTDLPLVGVGLGQSAAGGGGGNNNPDIPFVVSRPNNLSMVPVQQGSNTIAQNNLNGSTFASTILASNPALQLAGTFLDGIQVDFLLEATQADRRSVTLTQPRLTFTNGASATISVLTEQAFISDLNIITGTGGIGFEPQIGRVSKGFVMALNGVVSADRRYVTMEVQAQLSEILDLVEFVGASQAVASGSGGSVGGGVVQGNIQQPVLQTTQIRTGVTVPDQGTILLGGQRISNKVEIESGVPVLSKIPVINRFFSNRIEDKKESTLLILLKPTILIQNEEEEKNFPGLLDSLHNRFGAGF